MAKPSKEKVIKMAIAMFPNDLKQYWLDQSVAIQGLKSADKLINGLEMPRYVECLTYVLVAGVVSYNAYHIPSIAELFISLINLVNIILDFQSEKTPPKAFKEALGLVNKKPKKNNINNINNIKNKNNKSRHNNNNNNRSNTNYKSRNRGGYNGVSNGSRHNNRGRGGYYPTNNHFDHNNIPTNNNTNLDFLSLLSQFNTNNNNNNLGILNNGNGFYHQNGKKHNKNKTPTMHVCYANNCNLPGCKNFKG